MERIDDTGFSGFRVIQTKGSGYGVDAVLLAAFAAGDTGAKGLEKGCTPPLRVAELGTGCGVAAFILFHKLCGAKITGYDVNEEVIERANRACEMNGLAEEIDFACCDVKDIEADGGWDAVISNPPYFRRTPDEPGAKDPDARYIARHETTADISDFAAAASRLMKEGGHLYMVHRPDRLVDIFHAFRASGIEPKELQFVVPKAGKPANIVLIHGVKGAGPELNMLPGIAVHTEDGGYTKEILEYYERGVDNCAT